MSRLPWFAFPVLCSLAGGVLWAMVFVSRGGLEQLAQLVLALIASAACVQTWRLAWRLRRLRLQLAATEAGIERVREALR